MKTMTVKTSYRGDYYRVPDMMLTYRQKNVLADAIGKVLGRDTDGIFKIKQTLSRVTKIERDILFDKNMDIDKFTIDISAKVKEELEKN